MIERITALSPRQLFATAALACAGLLAYGFYLQYVEHLDPCPLCLLQRAFFLGVLAVCALGAIHGPRVRGSKIYAAGALPFAAAGIATAGRQVWLQHLPADQVPQCGPDLYFMLETMPLGATIQKLFMGSGQCAAVDWTFLGLSIAEWSLAWFIALGAGAFAMIARRATGAIR